MPRKPHDIPSAAERAKMAQDLRDKHNLPANIVGQFTIAGKSRRQIVDDLREWLKDRPKKQ